MKTAFLFVAILFSANFALASSVSVSGFYTCSFDNGKQNTWVINIPARSITAVSSAHRGPIPVKIDDAYDLGGGAMVRILGALPSPWAAGTTYEVELRDTAFTSTVRFTGPDIFDARGRLVAKGHTVSIPMACR